MLKIIPSEVTRATLNQYSYLFYGASGSGMLPLIQWLLDGGAQVCAIDDSKARYDDPRIISAPSLDSLPFECNALVYTTALKPEHPVFSWAEKHPALQLCASRPDFLSLVCEQYSLIAITGTHGKTNTTAAMSWLLEQQGLCCDYLIGGMRRDNRRYGAQKGDRRWLIIEADESQTTLQNYHPEIAIVLNSSGDHLEFFQGSTQNYHANIAQFMEQSQRVIIDASTAKQHQWFPPQAIYFDQHQLQTPQGPILSSVVSSKNYPLITQTRHAWQFQMAGLALCQALGLPLPQPELWRNYPGVAYRLEPLDCAGLCWRDYGHHPTELLGVYDALRQRCPNKELVIVFQPHKYSRTAREFKRFVKVLRHYDRLYLMPTEPAGEDLDPQWESDRFLRELNPNTATYWSSWEKIDSLHPNPDRLILFQGAGKIMHYAARWAQKHQGIGR